MPVLEWVLTTSALVAIMVAAATAVWALWLWRQDTVYLAPLTVAGKGATAELGEALAHLLRARLELLERELSEARAVFDDDSAPTDRALAEQPWFSLPARVVGSQALFDPPTVELQVGGVQVGHLFLWVQRRVLESRTLRFSLVLDGDRANAAGALAPLGLHRVRALSVETPATVEVLVSRLAMAILQASVLDADDAPLEPFVSALDPQEFEAYVDSVVELARLRRRSALGGGREGAVGRFAAVHDRLAPIARRFPESPTLRQLTASVAEQAERFDPIEQLDGVTASPPRSEDGSGAAPVDAPAFVELVRAHARRLFPGQTPPRVEVTEDLPGGVLALYDAEAGVYRVAGSQAAAPGAALHAAVDSRFLARNLSRCPSPLPEALAATWRAYRTSVVEVVVNTDPVRPSRYDWAAPRERLYQAFVRLRDSTDAAAVRQLALTLVDTFDCRWSSYELMAEGILEVNARLANPVDEAALRRSLGLAPLEVRLTEALAPRAGS